MKIYLSIIGFLLVVAFHPPPGFSSALAVLDTGDPHERVCNPQDYTDLGNGIIRDTVTGLEWQQETSPGTAKWSQAVEDCAAIRLGGHDDWRLPSIQELLTLVDSGRHSPATDSAFFPGTVDSGYWSATATAKDPNLAWTVNFKAGHVAAGGKHVGARHVRAVRGEQSPITGRLTFNGDGTVTDVATGLMWQQASAPDKYTWQQAVDYCEKLEIAGYNDWRLPNRNELLSIVDYRRYNPALLDTSFFPDTKASEYWSSTTSAGDSGAAWYVNFSQGNVDFGTMTSVGFSVRAVRSGTCRGPITAHTITVSADPADGGIAAGGGTYTKGARAIVTATANAGYVFQHWTDGAAVVSTSESHAFVVTADSVLVAVFTPEYGRDHEPCPATSLLGAADPRLDILRQFRDEKLAVHPIGRTVIAMYYTRSQDIIALCENSPAARWFFKKMLEQLLPVIAVML